MTIQDDFAFATEMVFSDPTVPFTGAYLASALATPVETQCFVWRNDKILAQSSTGMQRRGYQVQLPVSSVPIQPPDGATLTVTGIGTMRLRDFTFDVRMLRWDGGGEGPP